LAGNTQRAWQQRLSLEIPLPVPRVELAAANPFVAVVDEAPVLKSFSAPVKVDAVGHAKLAILVDNRGESPGGVPLELPFPGIMNALLEAMRDGKYEPARSGGVSRSSWMVIELGIETRIKEAVILHQELALPDPDNPPEVVIPAVRPPSGRLLEAKTAPREELESLARPKKIKFRSSSSEQTVSFQALVHINGEGRCDRYVPLLQNTGLDRWFSGFLATWKLSPPLADGEPTEAWLVYTARVRFKFSSFQSSTYKLLSGENFQP